mmetsp:Transcript_32929/g.129268  ORF Transcript_32929/g.129268 Transcript_32929/m.129268 type:complete len:144 (-) Transcript_32929:22-453(-)
MTVVVYAQFMSWKQFSQDLDRLMQIINAPTVRSFCHTRLLLLLERFKIHLILNAGNERLEQIAVPHRDFYNVRKVDTHVHHSSCMNQKHLLRFIKHKLTNKRDEEVLLDQTSGKPLTLKEVRLSALRPREIAFRTSTCESTLI